MKNAIRLLLLLWVSSNTFVHAEDFLDPDVAFKFSARALDAKTLQAHWQIGDGYYLYRHKFKFELTGGALGSPRFPAGKVKEDENVGKVEIYRKEVRIVLPLERTPGTTAVTLKATYQGCADAGLCYTPQTRSVLIKLPALPAVATPKLPAAEMSKAPIAAVPQQTQSAAALAGLKSLAGGMEMPRVLPPDEAFKTQAEMKDAQTVVVNYRLAPGTYLYRDRLKLDVTAPGGVTVKQAETPQPDVKDDPNFGRTEVYHHDFSATFTLSRALSADEKLSAEAGYQGCNETAGICYPPLTTPFTLAVAQAVTPQALPSKSEPAMQSAPPQPAPESDTSRIEKVLKGGSFFGVLAAFFGFGLLLALTPCVFPMIPILSGIIAGQNKTVTKTSGFLLALAYVLGMAITYALAGVAAALSGTLLSNALQNPWALGVGALIFVALALSMFGFYELQLPSAIQSQFSERANRIKGGHFAGVFGMGAVSAVIVGPCVAPPLAAALAFIAQTGNTVLGGAALFMLALGMGVPLLLVGLSAGALLPRAGAWMNAVKYSFGVLMLAIAIYLISSVIPAWLNMLLWATLLIASAIYLHALEPLPSTASGWKRLWKGIGVVLLIAGGALLVGVAGGSRDVLQPLDVFKVGVAANAAAKDSAEAGHSSAFARIKTVAELDARLAAARGKPVMLDFIADWCVSCKEMERYTFSDPKVQAQLRNRVLLQADVTANTEDDRTLLKRFNLFGPPGMIFWNADGSQSDYTVVGYEPPEKFLESLAAASGQSSVSAQ